MFERAPETATGRLKARAPAGRTATSNGLTVPPVARSRSQPPTTVPSGPAAIRGRSRLVLPRAVVTVAVARRPVAPIVATRTLDGPGCPLA